MHRFRSLSWRTASAPLLALTCFSPFAVAATDIATWDGTFSNWSTPAHWTHSNPAAAGQVPNDGNGGFTYDVIINGGSANQDIPTITLQTLTLNAGNLAGNGTLNLAQTATWAGGAFAGNNTVTFNNGANLTGSNKSLSFATLVNPSGKTFAWSAGNIDSGVGAVINNAGTINISNNLSLFYNLGGTRTVLNNTNWLAKSAGTGTAFIGAAINNSFVAVGSFGTLNFGGGGNSTGQFDADISGYVEFSANTSTFTSTSTMFGSGTFVFSGGANYINGSYSPGHTIIGGGSTLFNSSLSQTTTLTMTGGLLAGTGTFTETGAFNMTGGGFADAGTANLNGTGSISGGTTKSFSARAVNIGSAGSISWEGGNFDSGQGATLNNAGNFTTNFDGKMFYDLGGAQLTVNNTGTISKTSGSQIDQTIINAALNNSGTIIASAGTIAFINGGSSSGKFITSSGGAIELDNGGTLTAASSVSGTGGIVVGVGTTTFNGAYAQGATTTNGGYAAINTAAATTGTLIINGGGMAGTGTLTANGTFFQTSGGFYNTGTTILTGTGTILNAGVKQISAHHVVIGSTGKVTWTGGNFDTGQGGFINNAGTFSTNFDGSMLYDLGGAPLTINNSGTFSKTGGSSTSFSSLNVGLNNTGAILASFGTVSFGVGGTSSGTFNTSSGGGIRFDNGGGTQTLTAASTVSGFGTMAFASGTTSINGAYSNVSTAVIGGVGAFNAANSTTNALTIATGYIGGTGKLTASGAFNLTAGGFVDAGTTVLNGSGSISTAGTKQLSAHALSIGSSATIDWNGGNFDSGQGAQIINAGTFTSSADTSFLYDFGGTVAAVTNTGLISKTAGAGATVFNTTLSNNGTISAASGSIQFLQGGTSTGKFIPGAAGEVNLSGNNTLTAASAVSGAGTMGFDGGSTSISGSYAPAITVTRGGFAAFNSAATTGQLYITNGGVAGTSTLTVSGAVGITAGGFVDAGTTVLNGSGSISSNSTKTLSAHKLVIGPAATIAWNGGNFDTGQGAVLYNNGTFTTSFDGNFLYDLGGTPLTTNNAGLLIKTGGSTLSTSFSGLMNNTGTVSVTTGTLAIGGGASSGTFIAGSGSTIQFGGGGTQTTTGTSKFTGAGTVVVSSGTVIVGGTYDAANTFINGAVLALASGTNRVLTTKTLTIAGTTNAWSGQFNLTDGDAVIDYTGASPFATVQNQIKTGYAGGGFNGAGIMTSLASATRGLGYAEASSLFSVFPATFSGQSVDNTSMLIKYTYYGDTNLDGKVDVADLGTLATHWQQAGNWVQGDFNYSGFVDVGDLGLLATNWQAGVGSPLGPTFAEALAALGLPNVSVPEPALMGIGLGFITLARRTTRLDRHKR